MNDSDFAALRNPKGQDYVRNILSTDPREANSNYGFNLPWWNRLLGTCIAQPAKGHAGMGTGIDQFRTRRDLWLDWLLIQPVLGPVLGRALDPRITTKEPTK